jgi:hypothetical protein
MRAVVPVNTGQSSAIFYSVVTKTGEYIVRIHGDDPASYQKAILMQQVASENGIGPPLVHLDHDAQAA